MNIVGASNRFVAEVDDTNRLKTRSVSQTDSVDAVLRGDGFRISTPDITLTSGNESAVLVFTTDEDRDLIVVELGINIGLSAGGTDSTVVVTTAVGLDLVMAGGSTTELGNVNLIIGNPRTLNKTSESGQEAATLTGGLQRKAYYDTGSSIDDSIFAVFPKGSQFGLLVTPPPGNTSLTVSFEITAHLNKSDS